ncbi:hypothetical protein H9Y04_20065 [Streptomyces sp. TRM66268-LWL]|uniref:TY-Chap N-terminal domain-containing protein n=1 Tax=Streptomyces polyasparticus TaxID=2767826 RepID=A0ABR7SJH3_9ACTN|nr:hypothetical protein [Streptomyces polyasparticus]MBC9714850.1 hypothetical protein [Streptomyces polyasparticus]
MDFKEEAEWKQFRGRLASALRALPAGSTLVVTEPDPPRDPAPPRRWWQPRQPKGRQQTGRYVQFIRWDGADAPGARAEDVFSAECVSGAYRGISEEQHRRIVALGWSDPEAPAGRRNAGNAAGNFSYEAPLSHVDELAGLCAAALAVLGDRAPDSTWRWETFAS